MKRLESSGGLGGGLICGAGMFPSISLLESPKVALPETHSQLDQLSGSSSGCLYCKAAAAFGRSLAQFGGRVGLHEQPSRSGAMVDWTRLGGLPGWEMFFLFPQLSGRVQRRFGSRRS